MADVEVSPSIKHILLATSNSLDSAAKEWVSRGRKMRGKVRQQDEVVCVC